MDRISATDLRPKLKSTIVKVESGRHVAVTKLNLPKMVLVDVGFYERAVKALAEEGGAIGKTFDPEDIERAFGEGVEPWRL